MERSTLTLAMRHCGNDLRSDQQQFLEAPAIGASSMTSRGGRTMDGCVRGGL
jgi:hypothetical protein